MKGNKLLPLLLITVVGIVTALLYAKNQPDAESSLFGLRKPASTSVPEIDADLPQNTLDKLAVDSASLKEKIKGYSESMTAQERQLHELTEILKEMRSENGSLRKQLEQQNQQISAVQQESSSSKFDTENLKHELLGSLEERMKFFRTTNKDYPIGGTATETVTELQTSTRVHSVNITVGKDGLVEQSSITASTGTADLPKTSTVQPQQIIRSKTKKEERIIDPRYTIPANSILDDSVTVTTLIGRVPIRGDVRDPAPFKIVIGQENLTANGFQIPGLDGMIMSGTVFGDAVLSCVRTEITSATYIFEDGSALTVPNRKTDKNLTLGYLTDAYGNPCIPGKYISNVMQNTSMSILAGTASGAANAYAEKEVTTQAGSNGSITRAVTGDTSQYVLGQALSGGTRRMTDYLDRQQYDQWAAVIVPNGVTVAAHIEHAIEVDNSNTLRKIVYESDTTNDNTSGLTD